MKKVLIITTHFSPDIHVGAKRTTKFGKYLPQYGWQPVILTKEVQYYHGIDETLNEDLPPDIPIYRVREWHPFKTKGKDWKNSFKEMCQVGLDKHVNRGWISHVMALLDIVFFYDYSWLLPAFFSALRLIKEQEIKLVFSTSPNPEAHLVGLLLKVLAGVKWVCEFRDPWTGFVTSYHPRSVGEREANKYLEKLTMRKSDRIVTVGEILKEDFVRLSGDECNDKINVIYNGYDKGDSLDSTMLRSRMVDLLSPTWAHGGTLSLRNFSLGLWEVSYAKKNTFVRE